MAGTGLSFGTVVVGYAAFCIVVMYNNVLARQDFEGGLTDAVERTGAVGPALRPT